MVLINDRLDIPEEELSFSTSRSSGPGGQNVNKVSTRVTLRFDVADSPTLDEGDRQRILEQLKGRVNKQGILRVVSQRHRTQSENREAAVGRFAELLHAALEETPARLPTETPASAQETRIEGKRRRGRLKRSRGRIASEEE